MAHPALPAGGSVCKWTFGHRSLTLNLIKNLHIHPSLDRVSELPTLCPLPKPWELINSIGQNTRIYIFISYLSLCCVYPWIWSSNTVPKTHFPKSEGEFEYTDMPGHTMEYIDPVGTTGAGRLRSTGYTIWERPSWWSLVVLDYSKFRLTFRKLGIEMKMMRSDVFVAYFWLFFLGGG